MRYKKVSATQIAKYLVEVKTCWDRKYDYPVSTSWRHGRKFLDGFPRNSTGQKEEVLIFFLKHFWKKKVLTTATPRNRHELRLQCYGFNPCFRRPLCNMVGYAGRLGGGFVSILVFLDPFATHERLSIGWGRKSYFVSILVFVDPFCNRWQTLV